MIAGVYRYLEKLQRTIRLSWSRFWFAPSDPLKASVLRIVAGVLTLYFVLSHTADLTRWFGPEGLLPVGTVKNVLGVPGAGAGYYFSYFNFITSPVGIWLAHVAGIVVVGLFLAGWKSRITSILTLVVALSYMNRAPMITGLFEPVLAMMLFYLCLAPTGARFSVDECLRNREEGEGKHKASEAAEERGSWAATMATRLIQVHLSGLVILMALNKLSGNAWWDGGAMWLLIAQTDSRLIDFSFLQNTSLFVINALTLGVVWFELLYGVLLWSRLWRPVAMTLAVLVWGFMALVTGFVPFYMSLLAASLAFVSVDSLRAVTNPLSETAMRRFSRSADASEASDQREVAAAEQSPVTV